ncbi:MAG TPA: redoxin family protein [bacterium]|jgi:thiol-disulfide isomerase/thioredoxin
MKRLSGWIALALMGMCVAPACAADFSVRVYKPSAAELSLQAATDSAKAYDQQKAILRDYQAKYPTDMGVQLRVATVLAVDNLDSARNYYRSRAEQGPSNVVAVFITGRLSQSPDDQRKYADLLLKKDPDSYWGNLLIAGAYAAAGDSGLGKAEVALRKAIAKDNSLPWAVESLGNVLARRGDRQAADEVFAKLAEMQPDNFVPLIYRIRLAGDQAQAVKLLDDFLARNPNNVDALYTKARAQREQSDWQGHIATMRKLVSVSHTGDHAYDLGCGYALAGEKDSAFTWLFTAADLGFCDIEQYKKDEDLIPLRDDSRWNDLLAKVQMADRARLMAMSKQAQASAPQRNADPSAAPSAEQRLNLPAPDFTLNDLASNKKISLASLRGKVVILDFWATWCGPCRMSMPLLDKFYTDASKPKDVVVYGVNVFERSGTDKLKPFLTQQNVHFPVLLGTNDMATDYGVNSIPTLVVIDKDGKIAYRHVGYSPSLQDMLKQQTKSLLK